jgi:hypothetical protein
VISYFPEFDEEVTDPGTRAMLVRHAASMATGHITDMMEAAVDRDPADPMRGFLLLPPEQQPGTVFCYNQAASYTLSAIIQRTSGLTLTEYLRPRLLEPLGIEGFAWEQYAGHDVGMSGLHVTTDAIARLGELHLRHGLWNGRRVLPEAWVAEATRPHIPNPGPNPDWQQGYGFQFWMSRHGYRGDGACGQFCLVLPEQDAVVAITAGTNELQGVLDLVWQHLLPAFDGDVDADADSALRDRLSRLRLPTVQGRAVPVTAPDAWSVAAFTPAGGACPEQPGLTEVSVSPAPEGWQVALTDSGETLTLKLRTEGWNTSPAGAQPPTGACGAWSETASGSIFTLDVAFLETPHRLTVTCALPTRTFEAHWQAAPLGGSPLGELRVPRAHGLGGRVGPALPLAPLSP